MSETDDDRTKRLLHDGMVWGFMEKGVFVALPKGPMVHSGLGPPPFDVTLPDGRVRHIIYLPRYLGDE